MFDLRKSFYYVFSNEGEKYYLPSTLSLSLEKYLYYQLRVKGYAKIFQVRVTSDSETTSADVTVRTSECLRDNLFKQKEKKFFGSSVKTKEAWTIPEDEEGYPKTMRIGDEEAAAAWLLERLSERGVAVIIDGKSFETLMQALSEDRQKGLKELFASNSAGTAVITFPMEMPYELFQLFVDDNSAFKMIFDVQFDPKVINQNYSAIDYLKNKMSGQVIELGNVGFDELGDVIDEAFFEKNVPLDDNKRNDLRNFLYYWIYSMRFRNDVKGSSGIFAQQYLSRTAAVTRKLLHDFLAGDNMASIEERMRGQRRLYEKDFKVSAEKKAMYEVLCKRYGDRNSIVDLNASTVKIKSVTLNRLEEMKLPNVKGTPEYDGQFHLVETTQEEWDKMRWNIRTPHCQLPSEDWLKLIDQLCTDLITADKNNDKSSVLRIESILKYLGNNLYGDNTSFLNEYGGLFKDYVDYSRACLERYRQLKQMQSQLSEVRSEASKLTLQSNLATLLVQYNAYKETLLSLDVQMIGIMSSDHFDKNQFVALQNWIDKKVLESTEDLSDVKLEKESNSVDFTQGSNQEEEKEAKKSIDDYFKGESVEDIESFLKNGIGF